MENNKKKKKLPKRKKKFFIILGCYVLTFVLTAVITASTLSWYNSSTWQSEVLYMGGPVYIHFSDDTGVNKTSGTGNLVTETPPGWTRLYPGMNINFKAQAVIEGKEFNKMIPVDEEITYYTTSAVLRAKVTLSVTDTLGNTHLNSLIASDIYNWIWPQLKDEAINDTRHEGVWIFDQINSDILENNYFYYSVKGQSVDNTGDYHLFELGGIDTNVSVGFLNNTVIQLPSVELTNNHADCILKFTIVFEAIQAFFPYEERDLGTLYQGDTTNRPVWVTKEDLGLPKPLTIANSRALFNESIFSVENGYEQVS